MQEISTIFIYYLQTSSVCPWLIQLLCVLHFSEVLSKVRKLKIFLLFLIAISLQPHSLPTHKRRTGGAEVIRSALFVSSC